MKGIRGIVFLSFFSITLLFAKFSGSYSGIYEEESVFLEIKQKSNGKISGSLQIGNKNYKIDASPLMESVSEAKGSAKMGAKSRDIRIEDLMGEINITLYPKGVNDKLIDVKLSNSKSNGSVNDTKVYSSSPSMIKNKINKKSKKNSPDLVVGKWISDEDELWLMRDGTYRFTPTETSTAFTPKKRFKSSVEKIREKIKAKKDAANSENTTPIGAKATVNNISIQIGDTTVEGDEIETKKSYDNKSWREKYKEKVALKKAEEDAKNLALASINSAGKWFAKNSIIYVSNGNGDMISFGRYTLRNNSMIIVKSDGTQIVYNKIN